MNELEVTLKKEDFKRFKKCFKISWALATRENLKLVQEWVKNKEISVFFDLQDNINSAKINDSDFIDNETEEEYQHELFIPNLYDLMLETTWPDDDKNVVLSDTSQIRYDNIQKQQITTVEIPFYPGETIADGDEVGQLAREFFMRDYSYFNLDHFSKKIAFNKTKEILKDDNYEILFEPSFAFNDCLTKCDILQKLPDGTYHLIEVKASTGRKYDKMTNAYIDKEIKDEYAYDVAYQYYVLTGVGLKISRVSLMLLNSEYYKKGDIDFDQLFMFQTYYKLPTKTLEPITLLEFCQQMLTGQFAKRVNKNRQIESDLAIIKHYFTKEKTEILNIFQHSQCLNGKGDRYGYCQHVTDFLPEHHSVFELTRGGEKKTLLKYQEGINLLKDIILPFTFKQVTSSNKPIVFSTKQKRQILAVQDLKRIIDDTKITEIKNILGQYQFPIYMYDFETMKAAIPRFDYSYSYQQIPFQYSVHIIKDNNFDYNDESTMEHYAFLADGENDPRLELCISLTTNLFIKGAGVYVAYYKSFECKVITELFFYLENLSKKTIDKNKINQYKNLQIKLEEIKNKTIDLMDFFKDFMIYKKEFYGSISIKKTQPAFDDSFTYKELKIQKGDMASEVFRRRVENNISMTLWKKYFREAMLKYCNRDTLAMVVIYQHILKLMVNY